jgi:hypothetical protein
MERLLVAFTGMSNGGKSHWSRELQGEGFNYWVRRLQRVGFERYCCDDLIEKKLGPELKARGFSGLRDIAEWMGQPFDPQYAETSKKYLDFEGEVVNEVLDRVENSKARRVVIDTTGSVIYLAEDILQKLSARTRVVYLETPESVKDEMYKSYLENPKPVIWGDSFVKAPGETDMQALGNCYPKLLAHRAERYAKLAHVTLDYQMLRNPGFKVADLMTVLKAA